MRYALITGASSGIGREFAIQLAGSYKLILVARREERLIELKNSLNTECILFTLDLSIEENCFKLFEAIKDLDIEIVINNAGFGDCGYFLDNDLNKEIDMINLNIKALHILTKLMINKLNGEGYILNVASSAGLLPAGPYMSTYYASKGYVTSLTRGIAKELKENHNSTYIGCLCPGPVDTEFNNVANVKFALKGITATQCVSYALRKMKKRKVVIIPGMQMKFAIILGRFIPQTLLITITKNQQKKKLS